MPSKTSKKKAAVVLPSIPKELIDPFVSGPMSAEALNTTSMAFKKALIEHVLRAKLSHHLCQPERFLVIFSVDRRKHPNRLAGWVQLGKLLTQPVQRRRFAAHQEKSALCFRAFGDHDATRVNILA